MHHNGMTAKAVDYTFFPLGGPPPEFDEIPGGVGGQTAISVTRMVIREQMFVYGQRPEDP